MLGVLELAAELAHDVSLRRLPALVEVDCADDGLEDILEVRLARAAAAHLLTAPQEQVIAEVQAGRELGERRRADDARARLRELALRHLREVLIKICAGGKLQHSISQEFETFVMGRVPLRLIGIRGMRQGLVEKSDIVERHAEAL